MNLLKSKKSFKKVLSSLLCFSLVTTAFMGIGHNETVKAATISPLITSYKPQVQNVDTNVSYTDSSGKVISGTIHHPGIAMSKAGLDNMRDHVRLGDEPWNAAFTAFANDPFSKKAPRIYYEQGNDIFVNIRGPWGYTDPVSGTYYSNPSDYVGNRADDDAYTAFKQAIMWYITGDDVYRSNAMYIIRAYSAIQSCATHTSFRFATVTYHLAAAAEILRYSDCQTQSLKWTDTDTQKLINVMNILTVTYNPHTFFMNQHQFSVMGTIGRAIFTNDLKLYAEAVEATTVNSAGAQGGRNGSIKYQMRYMTVNEQTGQALNPADYHVQLMEMGRDVGHSYDDVAGLSILAQTIYAQGTKVDPVTGIMSTNTNAVNAFNFLNDRLLEGTTYVLKYHLGYDVLWTPAYGDVLYTAINSDGRGRIDPFLSVLYNYYKYTEQRDMTQEKYKYLAYAYETRMPEVAPIDYPLATLLYTPDAAKTVGLSNQKILSGITGLTATSIGSDTIKLSWTAVPYALGYNIYRSTEEAGVYTKVNSSPITGTTYSDTGLTPDVTYYYKVSVAGGATSSVVSAKTYYVQEANLTARYKFNEATGTVVADSSVYASNGTANGGASWATGKIGNAVDLDGTDDYVSLPAGIVSTLDTCTVTAWVNLDTVSNWMRIFDFGSGTSTYMFLTPKNEANGKVRFAIKNNGSAEQIIDGTSALPAGGWHHVAVILNGSAGILYVDGVEVGRNSSMTIKPSNMGSTTQNWIGRSQFTDPYLNGKVDDFRIYRSVLSASDIATLAALQ